MDELLRRGEPDASLARSLSQGPSSGRAAETTVGEVVREISALLAAAGIAEAPREARDIVAAVVDMPRFWPSLNGGELLGGTDLAKARTAAARRHDMDSPR